MHGEIKLDSKIGVGTKASFWITFSKAQYQGVESSDIDLASIPDRLQSDMSVSAAGSEAHGTSPRSPRTADGGRSSPYKSSGAGGHQNAWAPLKTATEQLRQMSKAQRESTHVLVVEDK